MSIHILILNYNGRHLLQACLPTVLAAARRSHHACCVGVVDNQSSDDSVAWLADQYPQVTVYRCANRGLCSFNEVVAQLDGRVAVLLNSDIKLHAECIDPLVAPLLDRGRRGTPPCFMTAPLCRRFDGRTYEGFKTAVRWHWGLVQATSLFAGHESVVDRPDWTASAGAAIAVSCRKFVKLGGFDPLYLPGRLEDLDFAFRGYQAGYCARYVPEAIAYHLGMGTFGPVFGATACEQLALRNTLLFQWKNLRHPAHRLRQAAGLAVRLAAETCRAPWTPAARRWPLLRAMRAALARWQNVQASGRSAVSGRELEFFRRFHPDRMKECLGTGL
jgi:N-acetylglucosaminyl-diphospho-decaprenol L-rhamnosyltransferase